MARKHLLVVAIAALLVALVASPAAAKSDAQLKKLAGTMNGTATWTGGTAPCAYIDQHFDAVYPGGPGAGDVTLDVHACVSAVVPNVGTFHIATRHGTLDGAAAGPKTVVASPIVFDFDLTPTTGTGVYKHASGSLHIVIRWNIGSPAGSPFTATLTSN